MELCRVKYLKCLRTRKYILEHKCEWNFSLVWLFFAIVAFYLNCLDRVVLAHPFWALETFPGCFSVLSCWTNTTSSMGTKWSSWILKKKIPYIKSNICANDDYFMSVRLQWTIEKLVRLLLHTSENCSRKFHAWGTFCIQSVHEGWSS